MMISGRTPRATTDQQQRNRTAVRFGSEICAVLGFWSLALTLALAVVFSFKVYGRSPSTWSQSVWLGAAMLIAGTLTSAVLLLNAFIRAAPENRRRGVWLPLLTSCIVLAANCGLLEITLRALAVPTEHGHRIGSIALLPNEWRQTVATNRKLLAQSRSSAAFYREDPLLGWDIGIGRSAADGLYSSSAEGLRSRTQGEQLAARLARARIAIIGDSYTFGEEVTYDETWGANLEAMLDGDTQVLNFGVPSHAFDQTLLKFRRDVLSWKPRVTIFGFLNGGLPRSGSIYLPFKPDQQLPYSKPRFVLQSGRLDLVNTPVIAADELLAHESPFSLPNIDLDHAFDRDLWTERWFDHSYVVRFLASVSPRWPHPAPERSPEALASLAGEILGSLLQEAKANGSQLIVVFLPVVADVRGRPTRYRDALIDNLKSRGVDVFDPTQCLLPRLPIDQLFLPSGSHHYTPGGNRALAACLLPVVTSALESGAPASEHVQRR